MRKLIAGPTVFICDECVELCLDIFGEENKSSLTRSGHDIPTPKAIRKALDTSPFCSRSRFFVKVVAFQIGSSGESPTNQRDASPALRARARSRTALRSTSD